MKIIEINPTSITIPEGRQRETVDDIEDLMVSIQNRAGSRPFHFGLINAIVVDADLNLVAGERRLRAHLQAESPLIFVRQWDDLSDDEKEMVELEENTRRKDLHWLERAKVFQRIHKIQTSRNPEWTTQDTATYLGYSPNGAAGTQVNKALAVMGVLNDQLAKAPTLDAAYASLQRTQTRAFQDLTNEILSTPVTLKPLAKVNVGGTAPSGSTPSPQEPVTPPAAPRKLEAVHQRSFLDWAPQYAGHKFNFIHCDFPYGIDLQDSDQMKHESEKLYNDTRDLYESLVKCLCENVDRILYPSAHIMFWLSTDLDTILWTREYLQKNSDFLIQPKLLVWHKSCGSGMVPDARRRPRNTYEVALMGSRGDRFILKPVNSSYAGPLQSKRLHPSEKPEPMLKHFFVMFVNENTSILDPTAGSGSALRAADALGAKRLMGLEIDEEFCKAANGSIIRARQLREASSKVKSDA